MKIAVINSGSSSLKFKLFEMPSGELLSEQLVENIGEDGNCIKNHHDALDSLDVDFEDVDVIGHRVVHGGEKFKEATLIDDEVIDEIRKLIVLAPLHNKANLEGILVTKDKAKKQVAVFDTAFHTTMPKEAYMYALPIEMYKEHNIRRYGFHGSSHSYLLKSVSKLLKKRIENLNVITLHLGNGASVCAIKNGKSIDTSMGFTPLEGLVMGTRCGDIDPEIVLYMQKEFSLSVEEVDTILNKKSGLKGICGINDVRNILKRDDELSRLAIDMMVMRIQKYIGSYMVLLDGEVDAIVFSGGIGENSKDIQQRVLDNKMFKDIKYFVIKTDEELEIATKCYEVVNR